MKNYLLFLLTLIFSQTIFAQDADFIHKNKAIYKAEMQIVNGDYCGAMETYFELANQTKLGTTEKVNGLVSALECDSMAVDHIEFFINLLFEIGAPVEYFEDELGRYPYFSSREWEKLKKQKPEFDRNNRYIQKVEEMIQIDQAARGYDCMESMERADFEVYMMMQNLSREMGGGLLGSHQLGFDYPPLSYRSNSQYAVLLKHQINSRPYIWGEHLPQMYYDGYLGPGEFTFYYSFAKACNKKELSCFPHPPENLLQIGGQLYVCSGEMREKINENRKYFYLDSVEDQIAKSLYRASSDKPFRFIGRSIPIYSLPVDAAEKGEFFRMVKEMGFEKWME